MVKKRRWLLAAAVLPLILAACTSTAGRPGPGTGTTGTVAGSGSAGPGGLRAVRHVWVIELENQGYAQSFGTPSADPYLATTLPRTGALLENYYAIGHSSAANYIAQVSGQAPDIATQIDCPLWTPFPGQVIAGPYRQVLGEGCVYPAAVPTLGNQLSAAGRSWAAYLQDMGNDPGRDHTVATARGPACGHPATWAVDHTQKAEKGDQYAARHDGFTFFSSVTASQAFCAAHILSFRPLPGDLARAAATPAFSFIAPDLCNDGHDAPCVTGAPGGLVQADAFLSQWVPAIMAAPAYRDGGLIVITFDEGSDSGRLLRRDLRHQPVPPERAPAREDRPRRRPHRRGPAVPADQAGHRQHRRLQPLLAAALDRGHLRPAAPRRRGHAAGQVLRPGRIRLRKGRS